MTALTIESPWGPLRAVAFEEGPAPDGRMWQVIQCIEKDICVSAFTIEEARRRLDLTVEVDHALERYHGSEISPAPDRFEEMWLSV